MQSTVNESTICLSALQKTGEAVIVGLSGNKTIQSRLSESGFIPGTPLKCIQSSFLGGPLAIQIRGARMAIRAQDAHFIQVKRAG